MDSGSRLVNPALAERCITGANLPVNGGYFVCFQAKTRLGSRALGQRWLRNMGIDPDWAWP
jgi:hypothetical protein